MNKTGVKRQADSGVIDSMDSTGQTMSTSIRSQNKRPRHEFEKKSNLGNRFEKQNYMNFEGNIKSTNECDKPMSFEEKRRLKRQIRNLSYEELCGVSNILVHRKPSLRDLDKIIVDLKTLETSILREIEEYVASCQKEKLPSDHNVVTNLATTARKTSVKYRLRIKEKADITNLFRTFREIRKTKEENRKRRALLKEQRMTKHQN